MSLDLKNVIGSFMVGSAIMYAAVNMIPQNTACVKSKVALNSTKKSNLRLNKTLKTQRTLQPMPERILNQRSFTLTFIQHPPKNYKNRNDNINIEGAYIDRGKKPNSLITALVHIIWYNQKRTYLDYDNILDVFSKQFTTERISLEEFISKYRLCKLKDIVFLHPSNANSITFDTRNKGFYKGLITETTPYIVNVGNQFFPGVGKLNQQMIDLIENTYTDIDEVQIKNPIDIECDRTVRFN